MDNNHDQRELLNGDPLKIAYIVVQGDDRLDQTSPFQGFGESWPSTTWALRFLAFAPASFIERGLPLDGIIAQRMGGMNHQFWLPLSIGALEQLSLDEISYALVICSGEELVAERVDAWKGSQPRPVLHVRRTDITSDEDAIVFCDTTLRDYCRTLLNDHSDSLSGPRLSSALRGVERWLTRERIVDTEAPGGHNITLPNQLVMFRADRTLPARDPFMGNSEADYDAQVIASARSVIEMRQANGFRDFNRMYLPQPGLILTEPAFYRNSYSRVRSDSAVATKPMLDALRRLQKQTGLWNTIVGTEAAVFLEDPKARMIVAARQEELEIHTYGVGLMAAQTTSAVMRMRPAVNHVFPTLSRYAKNIRARTDAAKLKTPRLFDDIQRELAEAIGSDRIDFIEQYGHDVKIVSDAPIELLPIGKLPLALRYNCSRINSTPGNLMMGQMVGRQPLTLDLKTLCKVLVISAFADNDSLRHLMKISIDGIEAELVDKVEVNYVRVNNRSEMISALNASDATILIFDGHGIESDESGIGKILVNRESVNVWEFRGEARIPPIVVLSACDTHGIDAASHATVGNGFLAAGAITVLATLLPIGGIEGAVFVNRLLLRLGFYLPVILGYGQRVHSWCEVVAGLLRMVLGTDMVDGIVKDHGASMRLKAQANNHINSGNPNWYDAIVDDIAEVTTIDKSVVYRRSRNIMSRSESIRYIQLGSPECILIDDGSIMAQFFPADISSKLGIN